MPSYSGQPLPLPGPADPAEYTVFAAQVLPVPAGCHLWMGKLFPAGYGRFTALRATPAGPQRVIIGAHRYSYLAHYGPIPSPPPLPGQPEQLALALPLPPPAAPRQVSVVRHRCDITAALLGRHAPPEMLCVNPAHLALGDASENAGDRELSGRGGRRLHGVRRPSTDDRDPHHRSLLVQQAARRALTEHGPYAIAAALEVVYAGGDPERDQLALVPEPPPGPARPHLRIVR